MKHSKIAIIGAGRVGTTTAYALMLKNLAAEILLVDANPERCKGEYLDLSDVLSFSLTSSVKDACLQEAAQADIIIITAGIAQAPGQTRIELLNTNLKIMDAICDALKPINKDAIIIVVSNPLDILTMYIQNKKILPREQVFGSGTYLDSKRLQGLLSNRLSVAPESMHAYVLGEHGDSQFAAWSTAYCDGKPILDCNLTPTDLDAIAQATKKKAYELIACKGSTYYGIASCVADICTAIIFDEKRVIPVSWYQPEYNVCLSMPYVIGQHGIEKLFAITLNESEKKQLAASAEGLKKLL